MAKFLQSGDSNPYNIAIPSKGGEITLTILDSEAVATAEEDFTKEIRFDDVMPEFLIKTPKELANEINIYKEYHLRPISDTEYDTYVTMLATQKGPKGYPLYKHQRAAIARVIKENFEKYFKGLTIDPAVAQALNLHYEISPYLQEKYFDALEKFRDPFITTKAEEVEALYTDEEKARLRGLGIAFLDSKYKLSRGGQKDIHKISVFQFQHPMLKYNLVKQRKEK